MQRATLPIRSFSRGARFLFTLFFSNHFWSIYRLNSGVNRANVATKYSTVSELSTILGDRRLISHSICVPRESFIYRPPSKIALFSAIRISSFRPTRAVSGIYNAYICMFAVMVMRAYSVQSHPLIAMYVCASPHRIDFGKKQRGRKSKEKKQTRGLFQFCYRYLGYALCV